MCVWRWQKCHISYRVHWSKAGYLGVWVLVFALSFETRWPERSSPPAWIFSEPLTITATFEPYAKARTKLILIMTLSNCCQYTQWVGGGIQCYDCSWKIPPPVPSPLSSNYMPERGFRTLAAKSSGEEKRPWFDGKDRRKRKWNCSIWKSQPLLATENVIKIEIPG